MFSDFPTSEQFENLYREAEFGSISLHEQIFSSNADGLLSPAMFRDIDLKHWERIYFNRFGETLISFTFSKYYFEKGIPDVPAYISPGPNGESVKYFPMFEEEHWERKSAFAYYSDVFFYKLFSTMESVGHLLNKRFRLGITDDKVSFYNVRVKLEGLVEAEELGRKLKNLAESDDFKSVAEYRHAITHRHPPSDFTSGVKITGKNFSFGIGEYTHVSDVVTIMIAGVSLLKSMNEELKKIDSYNHD